MITEQILTGLDEDVLNIIVDLVGSLIDRSFTTGLQILWDLNLDIPGPIISVMEQTRPDFKLCFRQHNREESDFRRLATPLLHSLSFNASGGPIKTYNRRDRFNKMAALKETLLHAPNLRKLELDFPYHWDDYPGLSFVTQLPLDTSDRLPTLRELSFSGQPNVYQFDLRHCRLLSYCMDWSQLRLLDLGRSSPGHLYEELNGRLPSLRSLTLGLQVSTSEPTTDYNLYSLINFIRSVPTLHELDITNTTNRIDKLVYGILESQKTLQKLAYRTLLSSSDIAVNCWTISQLQALHDQCPDMAHLELDIPLITRKWSHDYANILATFSHLLSLKISVSLSDEYVPDLAYEYYQYAPGTKPMPSLNLHMARKVTADLFIGTLHPFTSPLSHHRLTKFLLKTSSKRTVALG
ncbi:MAG: hypothetical protein Q9170_005045 [Blastenia crenularia]